MPSWLHAIHEDHERAAFWGMVAVVGAHVFVGVLGFALPGKIHSSALQTLGTVLTAGTLFLAPYWFAVTIVRRLPQDSPVYRALEAPFQEPPEWKPILDAVPNVAALRPADRMRLGRLVAGFLRRVHFEGARGLTITDEIRLTVAAQACVLTLNLPRGALGRLRTILVYPTAFVPRTFAWHDSPAERRETATAGQSWAKGTVILAWDDVLAGVKKPSDGHNVALHEFAHQLDSLGGPADGVPPLGGRQRYLAWVTALDASFARFSRHVREGRRAALDAYGATSKAEFFAVATEAFFERPLALKRDFPDFYVQLCQYYRQDPATQD